MGSSDDRDVVRGGSRARLRTALGAWALAAGLMVALALELGAQAFGLRALAFWLRC